MNKIIDLIKKADSIVILAHDSEDCDAVGSSFAMCMALLGMGKKAVCVFSDVPETRLAFLGDNYIVFDGNIPDADLVICLDSADLMRLGQRGKILEGRTSICIDHHETNTGFADVNYIDSKAPATGEILYELICQMGISINKDIARNLYAAISSDTGSFKYSNVRPKTFEIASKLIEFDIDHAEIARLLYDTEPVNAVRFKGYIMNNIEQYPGGLNIACVYKNDLERYSLDEKNASDIVNIPRSISGCEIAVSIREVPDKIKLSFRSNGRFNVAEIAARFSGGGHIMAAGASVTGMTIDEVKEEVIRICEEYING